MDVDGVFRDLHEKIRALGSARLFTVTVQDQKAGWIRRAYTSHPDDYPTSVAKPFDDDDWARLVLDRGQTFVANTTAEFAPYFFDHELINRLGCHSALNVPVIHQGIVLGTINILDAEHYFTPEHVRAIQALIDQDKDRIISAMQHVPMGGSVYETRLARLRGQMMKEGVDLLVLGPGAHVRWLCGFSPYGDERPCCAMIGLKQAGFLMPVLNGADARQHTDWPFWEWADDAGPAHALDEALKEFGPVAMIGVDEGMRADHALLVLDQVAQTKRCFAADVIGPLRRSKDAAEIAALRENARIADLAQQALRAAIAPGVRESDLAKVVEQAFAAHGAKTEFVIIGTGDNSAFPHHHTGDRAIAAGDAIVCDIGAMKDGYYSDITRMACCSTMPDGYGEVHDIVDKAVKAALAAIRPGVRARDVDAAARGVIEQAGYGPFFTHRTGHGVGLEIHEPPFITGVNDLVLEEGMVFTIEPGIYLPGRFGVRLEEIAVVTKTGCDILSTLSRDVFVA